MISGPCERFEPSRGRSSSSEGDETNTDLADGLNLPRVCPQCAPTQHAEWTQRTVRTQELREIATMPSELKWLSRIKSPQLYRLSYRPKLLQSWWNLVRRLRGVRASVPVVYPNDVAGDASTVPPAPASDDDVMSPLRRWGCP